MLFHVRSFGCGVLFALLLLYIATVYRIDISRSYILHPVASATGDPSSVAVESSTNETVNVPVGQESLIKDHVKNSTFGFEKILAIGLPERSDRRDSLTLMSAYQNVRLEWMDAVKGEDMKQLAWPAHWNTANKSNSLGELGCWRSHVNAIRRVIDEGLSSALIIEDDADWDVNMRSQLYEFADKSRELGDTPHGSSERMVDATAAQSPYGDTWDILWLGACAWPPAPADSRVFLGQQDRQHMVFRARGGVACTWGYAINSRSAKTLLAWLLDINEAVDFHMSKYCEHSNCITVWPPLIGAHTAAGPQQKDSNIRDTPSAVREQGTTSLIVDSAILDMQHKLGGEAPLDQ